MSGIVALAAILGCTIPAAAASAAPAAPAARTAGTATVRPQGVIADTTEVLGSSISCGSATTCLAVGAKDKNSAETSTTPTAEALKGTTWKSVSVKIPKGATSTGLGSVSCKAATYCLAVGDYQNGSGEHPYALTWNGTVLTPITTPPVPSGSLVSLGAVSCVAVKSCVAAGSSQTISGTKTTYKLFADTWNGSKWTQAAAASPAGSEYPWVMALHCFSTKDCVAAGDAAPTSGALTVLAATWNGKTWTKEKAVNPAGSIVFVNDLSCVSAKSCAMVGLTDNNAGTSGSGFLEAWNGSTWREVKYQAPKGDTDSALFGVSCVSSGNCMATGAVGTSSSSAAAAVSWNGKTLTALKVPAPAKGDASAFGGVSCPKSGDCVAIGGVGKYSAFAPSPLAGYWNGKV